MHWPKITPNRKDNRKSSIWRPSFFKSSHRYSCDDDYLKKVKKPVVHSQFQEMSPLSSRSGIGISENSVWGSALPTWICLWGRRSSKTACVIVVMGSLGGCLPRPPQRRPSPGCWPRHRPPSCGKNQGGIKHSLTWIRPNLYASRSHPDMNQT